MLGLPLPAALTSTSGPLRGALWMAGACLCFAAMSSIIRYLSADMHSFQIVFFRNIAGFAFMVPWLLRTRLSGLRTDFHRLYLGRSLFGLLSMLAWFSALAMMPLAEATALSFTTPLFATIFAVFLLGEVVRARRWTATLIGFLGAMIVLRPGVIELGMAHALVIASAALGGFNAGLVKQLTRTESANAIVTYMTLYIIPMSLVPALFVWVTPPWHTVPWIVLLGLVATLGHQALTRAFAATDASVVMSFDFGRLPFVALIAWFAFGESPDVWTWLGAAVIVGSSVYITRREAALMRANSSVASVATAGASAPSARTVPEAARLAADE